MEMENLPFVEAVRLLARLEKEYPRGDMRPQATAMRQQLAPAAADGRLADASAGKGKAVRVNNVVAGQPGLSVQRVFIDAGHGGRDPGTIHNDVIERNITLDIALRPMMRNVMYQEDRRKVVLNLAALRLYLYLQKTW